MSKKKSKKKKTRKKQSHQHAPVEAGPLARPLPPLVPQLALRPEAVAALNDQLRLMARSVEAALLRPAPQARPGTKAGEAARKTRRSD